MQATSEVLKKPSDASYTETLRFSVGVPCTQAKIQGNLNQQKIRKKKY